MENVFGLFYQAVVDSLPKRRRLDERERSDVIHMLDRHCNKWLIKQRILRQTGKKIFYV